ncbi:MAG: hypothetical protein ACFE9T_14030 [Promethearchaeota archaeon]
MFKIKKYRLIFICGFSSVLFLSFLINFQSSFAQSNDVILSKSTHLNMVEFADNINTKESNSSITIPIASSTWNITQVNLNFSDIKLEREINAIEDNTTLLKAHPLGKDVRGMGVQINITEPTKIFGIYIYGAATSHSIVEATKVQITGYKSGGLIPDSPNNTIYGSTDLNMTINVLGWHLQTFPEPIDLSVGQYYLILNLTETMAVEGPMIYWFYNDESPTHPELHISFYVRDLMVWHWTRGKQGSPFLHKIIQRTSRLYYPENINMTAELNGQIYNVTDGFVIGAGNLTIKDLNYNPNDNVLNIQIHNNNNVQLFFNLSYHVGLKNKLISNGYVLIQENHDNNWTLTPDISRFYVNHSIKFDYPSNWFNPKVLRNGIDISSQVQINTIEKFIFIPNNTIIDGATWQITANSPNIDLTLNTPKTTFEQSQELKYSAFAPILDGNYTFILYDSLGYPEDNITLPVTSLETVYSYNLSSNPNEGIWVGYAFWYNLTTAGVKSANFEVNIDRLPLIILITVIIGSVSAVSIFTSYKVVKKIKRERESYRQSIYNKYMDILNLDYLIIIDKNSGINIFDKVLATKNMDASLISGFLEAIRSFGIDLTGSDQKSQAIKLEYQNSKILMSEFKNFRMTLIMKDNPSEDFLDSIKQLSYDIEERYGKELEHFDGEVGKFAGIKDLIEHHLPVSLIYPLKINESIDIKLNSGEKELIASAKSIMKQKGISYFFVSNLISQKGGFQAKEAELILNLIEKNIFETSINL